MLVEFKILVPLQGFPSYDACFAFYSAKLTQSVASGEMQDLVLAVAADMGAYELFQIANVTVVTVEKGLTIDTTVPDRDDISEGDFAGVVIGIVVAFVVLAGVVYISVTSRRLATAKHPAGGSADDFKGTETKV